VTRTGAMSGPYFESILSTRQLGAWQISNRRHWRAAATLGIAHQRPTKQFGGEHRWHFPRSRTGCEQPDWTGSAA